MRRLVMMMVLALTAVRCGSVDDPPLGGPYGGTTSGTDPNGGTNAGENNGSGSAGDAGSSATGTKDSGSQTTTKDSGSQQQTTVDSGTQQPQSAPTWNQIFGSYLAGSKEGRCSGCHGQGSSASNLYGWLKSKGYINGPSSPLVDPNQSCLSWYGGNMPPNGPNDANAVRDMNAWAAAGAANN